MKLKKLLITALAALMAFTVYPLSSVKAATASISGPSSVKAGDSISITLNVTADKFSGLSGNFSWDSDKLTYNDFSWSNGWKSPSDPSVNFNSLTFSALTSDGDEHNGGNIIILNFTVKSNLSAGSSIIITANNLVATIDFKDNPINTINYSATIASSTNTSSTPSKPSNPSGSSVNTLKSLSVAEGTISPAFDTNTTDYTLNVPSTVASLNITAVTADSKARVSVVNNDLKAGKTTPVSVTVTAENGATKTYVINAAREQDPNYVASANNYLASLVPSYGALSPAFNKDVLYYAINVPYECAQMTFTAAPEDANTNCIVLGNPSLSAETDNLFHVVCTAEDNSTRIYNITVRRATTYDYFISDDYTNSIIEQIKGQNKPVVIDMSKSPVQIISSKILSALKENPARVLIIDTLNGRITIKGSDLNADIAEGFYDFTVNNSSQYSEKFLSEGASGDSAVFSTHFQQLPGYAQITLYTNLTDGLNVNVYLYDKDNDKYIALAKNVKTDGGAVTFSSDTGGDFLVTTKTIAGASSSAALAKQSAGIIPYLIMIGAGLLCVMAGFGLGILSKKNQKAGEKINIDSNNAVQNNKKQKKKKLFRKREKLKSGNKTDNNPSDNFENKPPEGIEAVIDNLTNNSKNIE